MEDVLIKLKRLLNSIDDGELKDMNLWINCEVQPQLIALDSNSIVLITDKTKLEYDGMDW